MSTISITPASSEADFSAVANLFEAYASSLGIDLTFQDFATELSSLPGKYAAPTGTLLLARDATGEAIGCVGLRQMPAETRVCEMKRLYVDPKGRGLGVGKALSAAVIERAKDLGYHAMRLDTLPHMSSARGLYQVFGFREIEAYYSTPIKGTIFLELRLQA